jgi:DNA-binding IclR family transcriptional regulator
MVIGRAMEREMAQPRRTPAVHRAVDVLDTVGHNVATTPAALAARLTMAKSSIGDLIEALDTEQLLRRAINGNLRLGVRLAATTAGTPEDPTLVERALRVLGQLADVDGHTVSFVRVVGLQALCVDVRMGQHPLALTPRPGQSRPITESAGAAAVLQGLPGSAARELVDRYADHQGVTPQQIQDALTAIAAVDHDDAPVVRLTDSYGIVQLGIRVGAASCDDHVAAVLHLPDRLAGPPTLHRGSAALTDLATRLTPRA